MIVLMRRTVEFYAKDWKAMTDEQRRAVAPSIILFNNLCTENEVFMNDDTPDEFSYVKIES